MPLSHIYQPALVAFISDVYNFYLCRVQLLSLSCTVSILVVDDIHMVVMGLLLIFLGRDVWDYRFFMLPLSSTIIDGKLRFAVSYAICTVNVYYILLLQWV